MKNIPLNISLQGDRSWNCFIAWYTLDKSKIASEGNNTSLCMVIHYIGSYKTYMDILILVMIYVLDVMEILNVLKTTDSVKEVFLWFRTDLLFSWIHFYNSINLSYLYYVSQFIEPNVLMIKTAI